MSTADLIRLIFANLNRMRGRVAMTSIGVVIGSTAVIVLISLGVGLQESTGRQFDDFGDLTLLTVISGEQFMGPDRPSDAGAELDREAIRAIEALDGVAAVTPRVSLQGQAQLHLGRDEAFAQIVGVDPTAAGQLGFELAEGRVRLGRGQILVGQEVFANRPMLGVSGGAVTVGGRPSGRTSPTEEPVRPSDLMGRSVTLELTRLDAEGDTVTRRERVRIGGVFEEGQNQNDFTVYMALEDVREYNRWFSGERSEADPSYPEVQVKAASRDVVEDVQSAIEDMGFTVFSPASMLEGVNQVFLILQLFLGGIASTTMVVAAIAIAVVMTMAVYERTREIGIMKAIGASNNDVLRLFLGEAAAIGLIGGVAGAAVGWTVGLFIDMLLRSFVAQQSNASEVPEQLVITPLWLIGFAIGFATLVGLVSGVFPALRAANMQPLRALRTE